VIFISLIFPQIMLIFAGLYLSVLEKEISYNYISILNVASTCLSSFVCLFILRNGYDLISLISRDISYALITLIGGIIISKKRFFPSYLNKLEMLDVFKSVLKLSFMRCSENAYFRIPLYFYGIYYGNKNLGFLSQAIYLSSLQNAISSPIIQGPVFSYLNSLKNDIEIIKTCNIVAYSLLIISTTTVILLKLNVSFLIEYLYGKKWIGLDIMLLDMLIYSCFLPLFSFLKILLIIRYKELVVTSSYLLNMTLLISLIYLNFLDINYHKLLSITLGTTTLMLLIINIKYISNFLIFC
jgi:O-antigen/teichoic acid export membrane protein